MANTYDPYEQSRAAIERRRRMAEALQAQSMDPFEQQTAGGYVVPISPTQGLAKLAKAYAASKLGKTADTEEKALDESRRQARAQALGRAISGETPDYRALMESDDPELQSIGLEMSVRAAERDSDRQAQASRAMTAEEKVAMGLPADAVYTIDADGVPKEIYAPKSVDDIEAPSNVQEWEYFNRLTPEQQQQYLSMKRADKFLATSGGYVTPNAANPTEAQPVVGPDGQIAMPVHADVELAGQKAHTQAVQKELGTTEAERQMAAPDKLTNIDTLLGQVSDLRTKPNDFNNYFGWVQGRLPTVRQGTTDVGAKIAQVVAGLALENREKLKGSGAISDFESKALENSATILSTPSISEETAKKELDNIERILGGAKTKQLGYMSGQSAAPPSNSQVGQPIVVPW